MKRVRTRFAPSPTGLLHIGNARTAIINWLYAKSHKGEFILRLDDTDLVRGKKEYADGIIRDLKWLGLEWNETFKQSERSVKYNDAKEYLLKIGRLYPCYETKEELEIKRKLQLSRGLPPIYDRAALNLTKSQIENYETTGRKPHYRFLINHQEIIWQDMIKGDIKYHGQNLGDPIIIREDGSMTYMLCSTIDDIEYDITHILRGEDHVSNTAIQIQMFGALDHSPPVFGHLSLVKSKEDKISKREGGFEIDSLNKDGYEAMAINSFFSLVGSSNIMSPCKSLEELVEKFDIAAYSKSPTTYIPKELELLNHKLMIHYEYDEIIPRLQELGMNYIDKKFWYAVRPNLMKISDIKDWWEICHSPQLIKDQDTAFLEIAKASLPLIIDENSWSVWTQEISSKTGKKGKELFMPLRIALTGKTYGPELKNLLPLLSRSEILNRLNIA